MQNETIVVFIYSITGVAILAVVCYCVSHKGGKHQTKQHITELLSNEGTEDKEVHRKMKKTRKPRKKAHKHPVTTARIAEVCKEQTQSSKQGEAIQPVYSKGIARGKSGEHDAWCVAYDAYQVEAKDRKAQREAEERAKREAIERKLRHAAAELAAKMELHERQIRLEKAKRAAEKEQEKLVLDLRRAVAELHRKITADEREAEREAEREQAQREIEERFTKPEKDMWQTISKEAQKSVQLGTISHQLDGETDTEIWRLSKSA